MELEFKKYSVYEIYDLFKISFKEYMELPIAEADFCLKMGKEMIDKRLKEEEARAKRLEEKSKFNKF